MKCAICREEGTEPNSSTCLLTVCRGLEFVAVTMSSATDREGLDPKGWTDAEITFLLGSRLSKELPPDFVARSFDRWLPTVRRRYEELRGQQKGEAR